MLKKSYEVFSGLTTHSQLTISVSETTPQPQILDWELLVEISTQLPDKPWFLLSCSHRHHPPISHPGNEVLGYSDILYTKMSTFQYHSICWKVMIPIMYFFFFFQAFKCPQLARSTHLLELRESEVGPNNGQDTAWAIDKPDRSPYQHLSHIWVPYLFAIHIPNNVRVKRESSHLQSSSFEGSTEREVDRWR